MKDKIKIMVVDDEQIIRDMLSEHLTDEGYRVVAVPSGEAALEIFKNDPDHLLLADIRMPGMSGIELLEEVRKLDPDAMVIIITSHASLESAVATMRAGAYDYIYKPFEDLDQISHVVARAMDKIGLLHKRRDLVQGIEQVGQVIDQASRESEELTIHDELTGLFNHRYLEQMLAKEVSRARRYDRLLSLIALDVDYFEKYNAAQGRSAGDAVLRTMVDIMHTRLRLADMPTRYTGEKFVIVLPETDWKRAKTVADDIRAQVEHYPFEGREAQPLGKVTVSLGVVEFRTDADDAHTLLKKAIDALAMAKKEGPNQVVCISESD
jgi:two-component system cell cycle response regulator